MARLKLNNQVHEDITIRQALLLAGVDYTEVDSKDFILFSEWDNDMKGMPAIYDKKSNLLIRRNWSRQEHWSELFFSMGTSTLLGIGKQPTGKHSDDLMVWAEKKNANFLFI